MIRNIPINITRNLFCSEWNKRETCRFYIDNEDELPPRCVLFEENVERNYYKENGDKLINIHTIFSSQRDRNEFSRAKRCIECLDIFEVKTS